MRRDPQTIGDALLCILCGFAGDYPKTGINYGRAGMKLYPVFGL